MNNRRSPSLLSELHSVVLDDSFVLMPAFETPHEYLDWIDLCFPRSSNARDLGHPSLWAILASHAVAALAIDQALLALAQAMVSNCGITGSDAMRRRV
jgi:hypothetical protein